MDSGGNSGEFVDSARLATELWLLLSGLGHCITRMDGPNEWRVPPQVMQSLLLPPSGDWFLSLLREGVVAKTYLSIVYFSPRNLLSYLDDKVDPWMGTPSGNLFHLFFSECGFEFMCGNLFLKSWNYLRVLSRVEWWSRVHAWFIWFWTTSIYK